MNLNKPILNRGFLEKKIRAKAFGENYFFQPAFAGRQACFYRQTGLPDIRTLYYRKNVKVALLPFLFPLFRKVQIIKGLYNPVPGFSLPKLIHPFAGYPNTLLKKEREGCTGCFYF
ncbi:MAG: hypothetical protein R2796_04945 [Chitinophagaceae bacterium]